MHWAKPLTLVSFFLLAALMSGQEFSGSLSVVVTDPTNALVPGARLVLVDSKRGTVYRGETSVQGGVTFDSLRPSDYSLQVVKAGFDRLSIERIVIAVRDRQSLHLELKVAGEQTSITVTATAQGVSTDVSQGISLDHDYIENMPVNGRGTEALILMTPGITSASGGRGGGGWRIQREWPALQRQLLHDGWAEPELADGRRTGRRQWGTWWGNDGRRPSRGGGASRPK